MPTLEELLAPIPGDNPAGTHLRYDPIYDKLKEARRDDPLLDPPVRADWRQVIDLTGSTLAKKSKDLQLAAWYTEGLLQRDGLTGLRQGLELLQQLLEQYWDTIHPELDEDGDAEMRAAPLAWVGAYLELPIRLAPLTTGGHSYAAYRESRSIPTEEEAASDDEKRDRREAALKEGRLDPETFEKAFTATPKAWYKQLMSDLDASLEVLAALDGFGQDRFGDAAPSYKTMRDVLQEVRVSASQLLARKLELDPDPVTETPVHMEAVEVGSAAADAAAGAVSAVPTSREDAAKRVAIAARYLRADAPGDPAPFLLLRGLRWGELRAQAGVLNPRMLAAPPTEIRTRLKGLLLDGRWPELLEAAEEVMATPYGRGWLDLQRYVLTACAALGGKHEMAASAIRGALRTLLRDMPDLIDATLMDDSPTANTETRGWLRDQGILLAGAADDEEESGDSAVPAESLDKMLKQLGTAQPQRAVELLMRAANQEKSERARFLRRAQAAGLMVEMGMEAVAMPLLQEMIEQIDRHQLEDWESGETVARAIGLLYRCMTRMDADSSTREALYLRVCRLDPLQAMHFVESNGDEQSGE